jgi:hypothetical protein
MPDQAADKDMIKREVGKWFSTPANETGLGTSDLLPEARKPLIPKEAVGRGVNAVGMGLAGFGMGGYGGAAVGAGIGAMLPPSETPMMDLGATLAETAATSMIPGAGAVKLMSRLGRAAGIAGATTAGAIVGSMGDRAADFTTETPYGMIGVYSGMSAGMLGAMAVAHKAQSPIMDAVQNLGSKYGTDIPLSTPEAFGRGQGLADFFGRGSEAERKLALAQNKAGLEVLNKVVEGKGATARTDFAMDLRGKVSDAIKGFRSNPDNMLQEEVPNPLAGLVGAPDKVATATGKTDWAKFDTMFGLNKDERNAMFRFLKTAPDEALDKLIFTGKNNGRGDLMVRALTTMLPDKEKGELGEALVMRLLEKGGAFVETAKDGPGLNGQKMFTALTNFGTERLQGLIGPERAQSLKDLGFVMSLADPQKKLDPKLSRAQVLLSYITSKGAFAVFGGTALGGVASGTAIGNAAAGIAGGLSIVIPFQGVVNAVMQNPTISKSLLKAAQGDGAAADRIIRTFMSSGLDGTEKKTAVDSNIRSRMKGMFER